MRQMNWSGIPIIWIAAMASLIYTVVEVVLCGSSDTLSTWASSWWPSSALLVFRIVPSTWKMAENGGHRNVISAPRQRQGSAEHNLRTNSCCHNTSLAILELVICGHVSKCFNPWLFDGAVEAAWLTWFKCAMHKFMLPFLSSTYNVQERILYILCSPVDRLMSTSGWDSGSLNSWHVTVLRPVEKPQTSRSPLKVWSWHSIQSQTMRNSNCRGSAAEHGGTHWELCALRSSSAKKHRFIVDNTDGQVDTPEDKNLFHATAMTVYQRQPTIDDRTYLTEA